MTGGAVSDVINSGMVPKGLDGGFPLYIAVSPQGCNGHRTLSRLTGEGRPLQLRCYAPKRSSKKPRMAAHERLSVFSL